MVHGGDVPTIATTLTQLGLGAIDKSIDRAQDKTFKMIKDEKLETMNENITRTEDSIRRTPHFRKYIRTEKSDIEGNPTGLFRDILWR